MSIFLERGLVDANKIFDNPNPEGTMFDTAIKYSIEEMIRLLKQWRALTGAELKTG
ncbi:T3SS effector OspC family protein [Sodalis ligni]|uniref:T3SS effector OspC family protein n=1 Tax=Sodalis ligni TaxID=2697027 RepID=UPI0014051714